MDIYTATPELYSRYGFGEEAIMTRIRDDGRAVCHYHHLLRSFSRFGDWG
jgi:hypothetical protein